MALAAGAVAAFAGWLLEALAGHAHKVVPFILWSVLRGRGIATGPSGSPLGFADLYDHRLAAATYALLTSGIAAVAAGFGASQSVTLAAGGGLLATAGLAAAANLSVTPALLLRKDTGPSPRSRRSPARQASGPAPPAPRGGDSATLSLAAIAVATVAAIMAAAAPSALRGSGTGIGGCRPGHTLRPGPRLQRRIG